MGLYRRPGEPPPRVALLDLGTNTALLSLLVASAEDRCRLHVAEELQLMPGLGRERHADGQLNQSRKARARAALAHFAHRIADFAVAPGAVLGAATAACREAPDGPSFLQSVRDELDLSLAVVAGQEEAELVALAQERSFPGRGPLLVVDVGGGSTECAWRTRGRTDWRISLPLGAVKLAEQLGSDAGACQEAADAAVAELPAMREPATVVGVAGTATTAAQVLLGERWWDPLQLHGHTCELDELNELRLRLAAMSPPQRRAVPGLPAQRSDTLVAGLSLLLAVARKTDTERLVISDRGVRYGLLWRRYPRALIDPRPMPSPAPGRARG